MQDERFNGCIRGGQRSEATRSVGEGWGDKSVVTPENNYARKGEKETRTRERRERNQSCGARLLRYYLVSNWHSASAHKKEKRWRSSLLWGEKPSTNRWTRRRHRSPVLGE